MDEFSKDSPNRGRFPGYDVTLPGQSEGFPHHDNQCQDKLCCQEKTAVRCLDNPPPRCHSNESGVGSGHGSTPPTSETNFLRKEGTLGKEAWLSSEDSLFKSNNNPAISSLQSLTGQKVSLNDKRQVRFQKTHDSLV